MDWFLYDKGLRHERAKIKENVEINIHLKFTKIVFEEIKKVNNLVNEKPVLP